MSEVINIRKATRKDCPEIMRLIQELADYEGMRGSVKIEAKRLEEDGFDSEKPPFECLVVDDPEHSSEKNQQLIGYALYSHIYSTWEGKRLWLEDIMITERFRGRGIGNKLFSALCKEAVKNHSKVLRFTVLEWNPAVEFYKKLGMINITKTEGWQYATIQNDDLVKGAKLYD